MVKKMDSKSAAPSPNPRASTQEGYTTAPNGAPPVEEFKLDLEYLRQAFEGVSLVRPPKFPVGTTVPERVYFEISSHRPGISQFIEEAITTFDGDMRTLLEAAAQISAERKSARFDTGVRSISGRVPKAALSRLQRIVAALKDVPGMSLAKVLGGLVQIQLSKGSK